MWCTRTNGGWQPRSATCAALWGERCRHQGGRLQRGRANKCSQTPTVAAWVSNSAPLATHIHCMVLLWWHGQHNNAAYGGCKHPAALPTLNCTMLSWRQVRRMEISFQKSSTGMSSCKEEGGGSRCSVCRLHCGSRLRVELSFQHSLAGMSCCKEESREGRRCAMSATLNGLPAFQGSLDLGGRGCTAPAHHHKRTECIHCRKRTGARQPTTPACLEHSHLSLEDLDRHGVQAVEEGFVDLARMSEREGGGVGAGKVTWHSCWCTQYVHTASLSS